MNKNNNERINCNIALCIWICISSFAAGEEVPPEDMHMVTISVDHDEETNEMTISAAPTWDYPSILEIWQIVKIQTKETE